MSDAFTNQTDPVSISFTDDFGEQHKGEFSFKLRLSALDQLQMDAARRRFLGDNPAGASTNAHNLAMVCAQLTVLVTKAPKWWGDLVTGQWTACPAELLEHILDQGVTYMEKHREEFSASAKAAREKLRTEAKKTPEP